MSFRAAAASSAMVRTLDQAERISRADTLASLAVQLVFKLINDRPQLTEDAGPTSWSFMSFVEAASRSRSSP